jgi:hypothetical protein
MAKQTRRTTTRTTTRRRAKGSDIALPDEKTVRDTRTTVAVKPSKVSRKAKERIAPAAVDRRRQVIQTDEEMCADTCPPKRRRR